MNCAQWNQKITFCLFLLLGTLKQLSFAKPETIMVANSKSHSTEETMDTILFRNSLDMKYDKGQFYLTNKNYFDVLKQLQLDGFIIKVSKWW